MRRKNRRNGYSVSLLRNDARLPFQQIRFQFIHHKDQPKGQPRRFEQISLPPVAIGLLHVSLVLVRIHSFLLVHPDFLNI
jgi:hypothetical protein